MINYVAPEYHRLIKRSLWGLIGKNSLEMSKLELYFSYLQFLDALHKLELFLFKKDNTVHILCIM